jgi:hypothetical protein
MLKMRDFNITPEKHDLIQELFGDQPAETGGLVGSNDGGETIAHVMHDYGIQADGEAYLPYMEE